MCPIAAPLVEVTQGCFLLRRQLFPPPCAAARRWNLTPLTVGASSVALPGGITTREVGWAYLTLTGGDGAPLGLACVQSVVHLRRFRVEWTPMQIHRSESF